MAPMLLLETIKIEDGVIYNLEYHQKRCDSSREELYGLTSDSLHLEKYIHPPKTGLYRCRILYGKSIQSIEYIPYTPKVISSLKIISSSLDYHLKYANRDALNILASRTDADDILIEKDGYLTDTSIANIAFYDGEKWVTPSTPLLHGTMRQKLIDEGFLQTRNIKKEELSQYTQVALTNAMLGFKILNDINII
jgi:4-amino-4-deoxychorismate lyase